jgi:hypothetical protein
MLSGLTLTNGIFIYGSGSCSAVRPSYWQSSSTCSVASFWSGLGDDLTVKNPGEIDVQRVRRILEELRRRLADPARPQIELDYIERLLKDY